MLLAFSSSLRYAVRMTPAQCRAGRALINLSQQQLADAAGVGVVTVRQFETGAAEPRRSTLDVLRRALEAAGVLFVDQNGAGPGVRLRDRL
jgi:transcriptional regulator with XRE-family HTH domain